MFVIFETKIPTKNKPIKDSADQPYPATSSVNTYYYGETHPSQLGVDLMGRFVMGSL